jgi:superfamily I DNA/RNA helicase
LDNSRVNAAIELAGLFNNPEATKCLLIYLNALHDGKFTNYSTFQVNKIIKKNHEDFKKLYFSLGNEQKMDYFLNLLQVLDDGRDSVYTKFIEMIKNRKYATVEKLVEYIIKFKLYGSDLQFSQEGNYNAVTLTTAHSSKGKEWNVVYNTISRYDGIGNVSSEEVEETRRLFFVSTTRAKKELIVLATEYVGGEDNPDRHINRYLKEVKKGPVRYKNMLSL